MLSEIKLCKISPDHFKKKVDILFAGMNVDIKMLSYQNESYISYKNIILKLCHISYLMKVILNKR